MGLGIRVGVGVRVVVAAEERLSLGGEAAAAGSVVEVAVILPDDDRRVDEALPVEQRAW